MNGHIDSEMGALAVAGIVIVFGVLALIAGVVALFKRLDDRWQTAELRADEAALAREQNIDDTTLVIIAAAAATTVGGRFRVRHIKRLRSPRARGTQWSSRGRLVLQGSHAVRRTRDHR